MRFLLSTTLLIFLSFPSLVLSEPVESDDLVIRDGLLYKKFTDIPFTGEVKGKTQGRVKDGKRYGKWFEYHDNGQLRWKETYRDGKEEGESVWYHDNGQSWRKGTFRNGKAEGLWEFYKENGVKDEQAGFYKNGEKVSD